MAVLLLRPKTLERLTGTWAPFGAATIPLACDLVDETPTHDDDSSYATHGSGGTVTLGFHPDADFPEKMASVTKVEVKSRHRISSTPDPTNFKLLVVIDGSTTFSGNFSETQTYATRAYDVTAVEAWVEADFRNATFGWGTQRVGSGGAARLTSSWLRIEYVPEGSKIEAWRDASSRDLFMRRFVPEVYTLDVPSYFLMIDLLEGMNVSNDSLPRAASMLSGIEEKILLENWKRLRSVPTRIVIPDLGNPNGNMKLDFLDTEHYDCIARSTDKLTSVITGKLDGLAQMDVGASHRFSRDGVAWLRQADGKYVAISPSRIKMNHLGILLEEARTQIAKNSNFQDGVAAVWTDFGNGTVANETTELAFQDRNAYPNSCKITMGTTDTGVQQASMAVLSTDVWRTLVFIYRDASGRSVWSLQRASDSRWWDDTLESWEVTQKLNLLPGTGDEWEREPSNPIISDVDTDWTIQFFKDTTNSLENGVSYLQQFDNVEGRYIVAPLITDQDSTFTSKRDEHSLELDLLSTDTFRQMWDPLRGEHRVTYLEENGASRMEDGDKRVIFVGRFGTKDWDQVWQVDDDAGPAFVDITADTNDADGPDADPFPATEAIDDYCAFGLEVKFNQVRINIGTSGIGGVVAWEYWNGSSWTALANVVDAAIGFTATPPDTYDVTFDHPSDWATLSLNGETQFYVRARVTTVYSTNPAMNQARAMDFADDYDIGYYEKPAGNPARFVFERFRAGVSEAKATFEIDTVRGTSYELAFRHTDTDELGLAAKTLRVTVDGVNGVDAVATGQHSTTELFTDLWLGSAPPVLEMLDTMAFLSDRETLRTVHADEQILAMR